MATSQQVPQITEQEMSSFHQAHFSDDAVARFGSQFLQADPASADGALDEQAEDDAEFGDEDDLGYYEDGTKRTLTDEQIAIFRHSEIETLRRKQAASLVNTVEKETVDVEVAPADSSLQPGSEVASSSEPAPERQERKQKRRKAKGKDTNDRIDLRKRTWDVVDTGLPTLDYDD